MRLTSVSCGASMAETNRLAASLSSHLESQNVEFMQFAFRWMNCLLMREISVQNTIRMWDTYLVHFPRHPFTFVSLTWFLGQSEGTDAFSQFHLYVCCAFLVRWSEQLKHKDFQVSLSTLVLTAGDVTHTDCLGHYHLPPIAPYPSMGGSRSRNASQ